jgi:TolB-like protein
MSRESQVHPPVDSGQGPGSIPNGHSERRCAGSRALAIDCGSAIYELERGPEQEFFADGLTEDLITELSKVPDLFVIARHSTFAYKAKPMDVRQTAHNLGVRYLVEGSARRAAERVRISAQLIDAISGNTLWTERFDRTLEDIFAVQDEVTGKISPAS